MDFGLHPTLGLQKQIISSKLSWINPFPIKCIGTFYLKSWPKSVRNCDYSNMVLNRSESFFQTVCTEMKIWENYWPEGKSGREINLNVSSPVFNGWRRTNQEIINCAKKYGLDIVTTKNYDYLTEFKRSYILSRLKIFDYYLMRKIFSFVGHLVPYIRMFKFRKHH